MQGFLTFYTYGKENNSFVILSLNISCISTLEFVHEVTTYVTVVRIGGAGILLHLIMYIYIYIYETNFKISFVILSLNIGCISLQRDTNRSWGS